MVKIQNSSEITGLVALDVVGWGGVGGAPAGGAGIPTTADRGGSLGGARGPAGAAIRSKDQQQLFIGDPKKVANPISGNIGDPIPSLNLDPNSDPNLIPFGTPKRSRTPFRATFWTPFRASSWTPF